MLEAMRVEMGRLPVRCASPVVCVVGVPVDAEVRRSLSVGHIVTVIVLEPAEAAAVASLHAAKATHRDTSRRRQTRRSARPK